MRIYIAAPYQLRDDAILLKGHLTALGHVVTSRWLSEAHDVNEQLNDERNGQLAEEDKQDIRAADVLLAFNPPGWERQGTGGRHFECGYAHALGKNIVLFGVRSNAFHYLPDVRRIEHLEDL